jgi:hypothetical protein
VRAPREPEQTADVLWQAVLAAGESTPRLRAIVTQADPDELVLIAVLRRAVPVRLLEYLGTQPPWSERPRVLGAIVRNPRTPQTLALRLVPALFWHDLAEVAASPLLPSPLRGRAEGALKEMIPELRLGEKISVARIATPQVLLQLLADRDAKVSRTALVNPRLREEDLLFALRQQNVTRALIEEITASARWRDVYSVRLGLVLQPRTPLAIALAQLTSLVKRDLTRIAETPDLLPLLQAAAARVAGAGKGQNPEPQ